MKEIELKLTIPEVNLILNSLAQMPFIQVVEIIQNIKNQAQPKNASDPV